MLEIPHQKAQILLQVSTDRELEPDEKLTLENHLATCAECNAYAESLINMETSLRRVLHAKWDSQQPNLNPYAIVNPSLTKLIWSNLLNQTHLMGRVTIMAILLFGYILLANLPGLQLNASEKETPTHIPTPSELSLALASSPPPSAQTTLVRLTPKNCIVTNYVVREGETLESIAVQHGLSIEAIRAYNDLKSNTVFTGMKLMIPMCKNAPTHTATTTITPLNATIFPVQPD